MIDLSKIRTYVLEVKFELSTVSYNHEIPRVNAAGLHAYPWL